MRVQVRVPPSAFRRPDALFREITDYAARFVPEMHAVAADTGIAFEELSNLPGFDTGVDSEIAALGRRCNHGTVFNKVSFGAEASLFHDAGHTRHSVRARAISRRRISRTNG